MSLRYVMSCCCHRIHAGIDEMDLFFNIDLNGFLNVSIFMSMKPHPRTKHQHGPVLKHCIAGELTPYQLDACITSPACGRAVYENFAKGGGQICGTYKREGANLGYVKRGGRGGAQGVWHNTVLELCGLTHN